MENIQLKELLQSVAGIEDKDERDNTFRVVKGISIGEDTMWTPGKDLLEVTNRKLRALYEFIYEDRVGGLVEEGFVKGNEWVVDGNVYLRETQRVARRVWERMSRR